MGESAVAVRTTPREASSSAMYPPRELPATCGSRTPSNAQNDSTASASASGVYGVPYGNPGDTPKPGRSTAITSRVAASLSRTGNQPCQ